MKISKNEPILKAPSVILFLIGLMVIIHITFTKILSSGLGTSLFLNLAFVPHEFSRGDKLWTLISYAFLHGSWEHLIMNMVWLLAFGSAVAKRIESAKIFLLFFLLCCVIAIQVQYFFSRESLHSYYRCIRRGCGYAWCFCAICLFRGYFCQFKSSTPLVTFKKGFHQWHSAHICFAMGGAKPSFWLDIGLTGWGICIGGLAGASGRFFCWTLSNRLV
jgi:hypothetical protein